MKCPVCGKRYTATICPDCGFDDSRNYERYPTFGQISGVPSISSRRRRWNDRTGGRKTSPGRHPFLTAVACAAILMLGIWIGTGIGSSKTTQPPESEQLQSPPETTAPSESGWEANLLRADPVPYQSKYAWDRGDEAKVFPVLGSEYRREQIASVTFLDTLADAPEDVWDVSEAGDGRVVAWVTPANELYDLYIAAESGVNAANACADLLAGYSNAKTINFGEAFHTTGATDMSCMFLGCQALSKLPLGDSFDTSAVQDMSNMFYYCRSLTDLTLEDSFDTSAVQDMSGMFSHCEALTDLTLGDSFDTSAVRDMSWMFSHCEALTDLTLGDSFDTSAVQDMNGMFSSCYSLTDLTLGNSFDTSAVQDMSDMFYHCEALTDLTLSDSFDTSAVQDMSYMFNWCSSLTDLTLGDSFVTDHASTYKMFSDCPAGADYQHLLN